MVSVDVERPRPGAPVRQVAAPRPAPRPPRSAGAIPHFPGLEGLRGIAVVAVVAYHAQYTWMKGGFLGVSTFFTLSGFLITSLLLNERGATGSIDLRQFWRRRFRRLMPAALAALALVVAYGWAAADASQRRNLAGDVLAALGYVANWRFLLSEQSYGDIFGSASPVAHFWSLAIEEQFYLFLPFIAWFLLIKLRSGRMAFGGVLALLTGGSLALTMLGGLSADATYYHTGTRAAELLVGALLAVAVFDRRVTRPLGRNRGVQAFVSLLGVTALAASVVLWVIVDHDGGTSPWLYKGGFAAYSLLTVAVILSSVTPAGPVRWLLAQWPLRFLGQISYGIYLYHWPIFLWLDESRTGLQEPQLSGVRLGATMALAMLSYYLLESPIRHASRTPNLRLGRLAAPVVAGLAAAVIAATITAPPPVIDFEAAAAELADMNEQQSTPPPPRPDTLQADAPHPRIATFGDSTAMMTHFGVIKWSESTKKADWAAGVARLGCGIGRGGTRKDDKGKVMAVPDICNRWALDFRQALENGQPNLALVQTGPWEVANRQMEGSDRWVAMGDPEYDKFLLSEMEEAVNVLSSQGAIVVWVTSPYIRVDEDGDDFLRGEPCEPARMDRLNELIRELPNRLPGRVAVVDLAGWVNGLSREEDQRLRPDGVHFKDHTAAEVMDRYLGDAMVDAYRKAWSDRAARGGAPIGDDSTKVEDIAKYIEHTYKVLVVGDRSAEPISATITDWSRRFRNAFEVSTAIRPDCGMLRTSAREGPTGARDPTPPDCQSFRQWVLDETERVQPDFVLILPSAWDLRPVRLNTASGFATWGDQAFDEAARQHYQDMVRQLNDLQAVVLWADVPTAPPAGDAAVLATAGAEVAEAYGETVRTVAMRENERKGVRHLELANWAGNNVASVKEGRALSADDNRAVGEWLAAEAYINYDFGHKLRPRR